MCLYLIIGNGQPSSVPIVSAYFRSVWHAPVNTAVVVLCTRDYMRCCVDALLSSVSYGLESADADGVNSTVTFPAAERRCPSTNSTRVPTVYDCIRWNRRPVERTITDDDILAIRLVFTARCYASAVLAMALCPSVRPSQVGVLLKRLNVGSHKQHHTIAQGL